MKRKKSIYSKKNKNLLIGKLLGIGICCVLAGVILFQGFKLLGKGKNVKAIGKDQYEIAVQAPNPSPDDIIPGFNVTYSGSKYAIDVNDVKDMINGKYTKDDKKRVFLTFDDGPSPLTNKILDILEEKDAKATFFVLGYRVDEAKNAKEILTRIIEDGNAIANHSYSHDYSKLYPHNSVNVNAFMDELKKTNDTIKQLLGDNFNTSVMRMPGGYNSREYYKDPNLKELDSRLDEDGIVEIDWNALNGDAEGRPYTLEQMIDYAESTSKGKKNVIILMHDTYGKENTVEALPEIIDYFTNAGYEFCTMK